MRPKMKHKADIRIVFDDGSYVRYTIRPDGPLATDRHALIKEIRTFLSDFEGALEIPIESAAETTTRETKPKVGA